MAIDLDAELETAIRYYEARFGIADSRYKRLPVLPHSEKYAQTLVCNVHMTVAVKVDQSAIGDDARLKYQIWHEAVHCLAPVSTINTVWFEEGLATNSALYAPHMEPLYREACIQQLKPYPAWNEPWEAFKELSATDAQIKEVHERADGRLFDNVTTPLIVCVFSASDALASRLCQRVGNTRDPHK